MSFRDNLQYLRASKNLTQEQLAMLLGVSRQSVTKWEAERSYPEMDKLLKICELFDCTLDDLVQGDVAAAMRKRESAEEQVASTDGETPESDAGNATSGAVSNAVPAKPEDVVGYDEHWRTHARKIALGVGFCAISVIPLVLLSPEADGTAISLGAPVANLSMFLFFALVAIGVAFIVPAAFAHGQFREEHPFVIDFYTYAQRQCAASVLGRNIVVGVALALAGLAFLSLANGSVPENVCISVMLLGFAACAAIIVYAALMRKRINVSEYNNQNVKKLNDKQIDALPVSGEERAEIRESVKRDKKTDAICGAVMIVATIIGLVWLFAGASSSVSWGYNPASMFWISWVVGGLVCGIVSVIRNAGNK